MALARTALRLAVVEALLADPTVASICGIRIFDSRISELDSTEPVPVVTVLTEDDGGKAWSQNGGVPFDERCELTLEIAMRCLADVADGQAIGVVETDREIEAVLDLLEHCAVECITVGETPQAKLIRSAVTRRVTEFKSMRFTSDDTSVKLAIRVIHLTTDLKGEDQGDATVEPTGPYAHLPQPLRSVALALPAGSSGRAVCDLIAAALTPGAPNPFRGADLVIGPQVALDPDTAPSEQDDIAAGRIIRSTADLPNWTA